MDPDLEPTKRCGTYRNDFFKFDVKVLAQNVLLTSNSSNAVASQFDIIERLLWHDDRRLFEFVRI